VRRETSRDPATLERLRELLPSRVDFLRQVIAPRATTLKLRHHIASDLAGREIGFDAWYREQAVQVPIAFDDRALALEICDAYGHAWWLERSCTAAIGTTSQR
jgi:hypothetical protein